MPTRHGGDRRAQARTRSWKLLLLSLNVLSVIFSDWQATQNLMFKAHFSLGGNLK